MGTYTVSSAAFAAACEKAEEQIRDDMKAGAVELYVAADSALEYLGEIIRINSQPREIGETVKDWIARVGADLDLYIQRIINDAVENNVARVAQENSK